MIGRVSENLARINSSLDSLRASLGLSHRITLLAVSKLQPAELILEAYSSGHRDFAENYIDELVSKASSLPADINWHMIGHIQSNKCKRLLSVPNLASVHSIDSLSLAETINKALQKAPSSRPLKVLIQVNTSGEASKSGVNPDEVLVLGRYLIDQCPCLELKGFMTIGEAGSIQDFIVLNEVRRNFAGHVNREESEFELSMGMSGDYEEAIRYGSNYIRVGTAIFGERPKH